MPNYHAHSLQLTATEEEQLKEVKERTGLGVKAVFMTGVKALSTNTEEK